VKSISRTGRFAVLRIATAGLVFGSGLLAAGTLGAGAYGRLALAVFIAKLALMGGAGSASGFIYRTFRPRSAGDEGGKVPINSAHYLRFYLKHLVLIGILLAAPASLAGAPYLVGLGCFLLLAPFFAIEPVARAAEKYEAYLMPDVVLSLSVLGVALAPLFADDSGWMTDWYLFGLALGPLLSLPFSVVWFLKVEERAVERLGTSTELRDYLAVVRDGFPLYAGTAAFLVFQLVDRFSFEKFLSETDLGVYMLAFQLAAGGTLLLTAMNFVSGVDFGKLIRSGGDVRSAVAQNLRTRGLLALVGLGAVVGVAWVLEHFVLLGFPGLTMVAAFLGAGLSVFHWAGSITSVAFYHRRQLPLTMGIVTVATLTVCHNVVVVGRGLDPLWIPAMSGLWLMLYGGFALVHVMRVSRAEGPPPAESTGSVPT